ncbi:MAG: hypothetical protein DCO98_11920 [Altererythrobacter sp. XM-24bin4]|nr:MAG: hypothetical protein DCO81_07205 [Candidatus Aquiluna sp. XM-24bin5]PWL23932.1 MAG: hypothetical protein DCO98_11920 [Altererythrobacter sp. XM-24bin4]
MTLALFTAQIGHYHDARYSAVAAAGAEFTVIVTQNEADFSEFMASGTGSYPVQHLFEGRAAYRKACATGRVWSSVHTSLSMLDPSVVIVAGWATPESFAAIAWARRNCRRLVMLSESQVNDAARSAWRERVKARVVGLCDAAVVGGPSHLDYIVRLGMPHKRVFMGYDAVDNAYFASGAEAARKNKMAVRSTLRMPAHYLLASARFIPKKNLPRLVMAYAKALKGRAEAPDLVILGDGPELGLVEAAIATEGLTGRVHLPGFRSYGELPALYGLSDGFVHVSTSEQWGLVINEAAASGVPVVASTACGATGPLVEDGVTGFVADGESEESIKNALVRLIELERSRRAEMGRAARERVAGWGTDRFSEGLLAACRIAENSRPRGLAPWDAMLLWKLSKRSIDVVQ